MRKIIGRMLEWFLQYEHVVHVNVEDVRCNLPSYGYSGDAGRDLFCNKRTIVRSGGAALVPSGIRISAKDNIWFRLGARSSTFRNLGLEVVDAVIDRDYRGELFAQVINPGQEDVVIEVGHRIVQIIPHRLIPLRFVIGDLEDSARGESGFGSSGL